MYYRKGEPNTYQRVLETALQAPELTDGANRHLFEDKVARYLAMNSLASHYFQLYEKETKRVVDD